MAASRLGVCWAFLVVVLTGRLSSAAEPWADPKQVIKPGLELWLDTGRQPEARKAKGLPALKPDSRMDAWLDASGMGRDVKAPNDQSAPTWTSVAGVPVVRFDGMDDCLRLIDQKAELDSLTIFLVAIPRTNAGGFRGLMALNARDQRDWQSGLTIDQGPSPSTVFAELNIEGKGFLGARNLLKKPIPFGAAQVFEVRSDRGERTITLTVDGVKAGERPRDGGPLSMDEITVGARFYTNEPGPQIARGFGQVDIAEVLVFNKALDDSWGSLVRGYLMLKYGDLMTATRPRVGTPLATVENPPAVQVLEPGFEAFELPLDLPNINNISTRPDGKTLAVAYNGDMYLLSDADGDGLEDKADKFWDNQGRIVSPIGMAMTPPGYEKGFGAFVAGKGKLSLVVDTNGDDVADEEIVVAKDWPPILHNVDALGTAFDPRDGSVYVGIGHRNFTNGYLTDKEGKAHYSPSSEGAAILKIAPDFSSREVFASGVRFAVGMKFNSAGDLFATDQEGATWLANGNPFDELLHIQKGRHYGFPPRHPEKLPGVIDEPSVYDYGPQHQSTCGFCFNEPVQAGGPIFGPDSWRGNAIVTGYSRGKIYRTSLRKTERGYVAKNSLFACLQKLTVDACIDLNGALLVATHSGGPDWGSGPGGRGTLYKIRYSNRDLPRPVLTWSAGPDEVKVAFDRPLDPAWLKGAAAKTSVQYGAAVRAGDRFETLRPGYAVVGAQVVAPRFEQPARSLQVSPDGRTLTIVTEPSPGRVAHAVTLPASIVGPSLRPTKGAIEQRADIDLDYSLEGLAARWTASDGMVRWTGWLPHFDLAVCRKVTVGSKEHDELWDLLKQSGELQIYGHVDLPNMLRPAVQPGSKIDYAWPEEVVTLHFEGSGRLGVGKFESTGIKVRRPNEPGFIDPNKWTKESLEFSGDLSKPVKLDVALATGGQEPKLTVFWNTKEDDRLRAMPLRRFYVPWSEEDSTELEAQVAKKVPELEGASWANGRKVFFGADAGCSKCHSVHGKGGQAAPDLSNLVHRDFASVMRDINTPNFAINPDFTTFQIETKSGKALLGTIRSVGEQLHVTDTKANVEVIDRSDIEQIVAQKTSIMPVGIPQSLGPEKTRDLLAYLLLAPPSMPKDAKEPPPPPRKKADVEALLQGAPADAPAARPMRVTLVAGKKDHGPGEHDYPAWQVAWKELLGSLDQLEVATAWEWPAEEDFAKSDVLVFYRHGDWSPEKAKQIDAFLARGGGLVYIHWAVDGGKEWDDYSKRIGLSWGPGAKFRHGPLDLQFTRGSRHPIARNFDEVHLVDESYWRLRGDLSKATVLATAPEEDEPWPLFWTLDHNPGRVFVSIPGHYSWSFDDPVFRILLLRGIAWTAKEPVDRFNDAVYPGAAVVD
ncbi:Trehalose utilization [Caulifigura coniformis]|uniref:Trehalose utilization n=1 Tax=Caulifigura coniformis TaxID=2527983 RepID=A0A517S9N5_9PLAN|nr:ThuA domain-containing protein [Caulifigura coniformis]QDT52822.1 Trehalose utilization [Caulifigura coniformis]